MLHSDGEYHGFEPDNTIQAIALIDSLRKLNKKIFLHKCTLRSSTQELFLTTKEGGASSISSKQGALGDQVSVEGTSLDGKFAGAMNKRIFVKLDIEGAELEVLSGGRKLFENNTLTFAIA